MTHAAHHPDDEAVDRFAAELKAKLADARAKGRGGWEDKAQVSAQALSDMLLAHVFKGDPRDVAPHHMLVTDRSTLGKMTHQHSGYASMPARCAKKQGCTDRAAGATWQGRRRRHRHRAPRATGRVLPHRALRASARAGWPGDTDL